MWRPNWRQWLVIALAVYLSVGAPMTWGGFVGVAVIWITAGGLVYWLDTQR